MFGDSAMAPPDTAAISGAQMILNVISLLTDRERTASDIAAWFEAGKRLEAAHKAHDQRERLLHDREADVIARESAAARREGELAEREVQIRTAAQHLEEQRASLVALKAEVKRGLSAAA